MTEIHDLRSFLAALDSAGQLTRVEREVSLKHELANVAATVMNLHGFEAPSDYEPTLIEVIDT